MQPVIAIFAICNKGELRAESVVLRGEAAGFRREQITAYPAGKKKPAHLRRLV
ncbi:hypothetical protein ACMYSK_24225 [Klebsiella sp. I138]|uniref:hypothetical protein n=1 Tax=Klebsiella sp. I138 TaxID=2755385 RepID=UPI003DA9975E